MSKKEIQKMARSKLSHYVNVPGSLFYSSHEALKSGDVYLLGFNPGGGEGRPLGESIESMLEKETNAYLDEEWENENGSWEAGEAPFQKRAQYLIEEVFKLNTREVCASNLIFFQSRDQKGTQYSHADVCWPVHKATLET